ncbi:uncharacterized protein MONOS_10346 [Monocercomonoides exilis]|uniref:uncharacterized protein n=1 Tax=Monocercomonoides exilis TaxID=2049356 RepID=UPI00355A798F|nr:hypothetical protein MONOS_10346 [Monocercomonoides exilis]|eukprot:MONOS_10346.1-p1 / transcript=MONOS_10346.1 / gene=MONOS_10346 / organism=Monocercomonoides_exilis_PA203 / gene_product=unspecified product / transcript_product=unspecified product / location=Mono_scaffold00466:36810-38305(-) / protein_length=458 / sequence_SO=supercontig / SO=protein_coding / is_pseudo=false
MNKISAVGNVEEEEEEDFNICIDIFVEEEEEEEEEEEKEEGKEFKTELTEKFTKLLNELEDCNEDEQKQKIEEMNEMINEMNKKELKSVVKATLFKKINKMIKEKKMRLEIAILLLRHIGYWIELKGLLRYRFRNSLLNKRLGKMIVEEDQKKEEKNEKLLTDVCECYLLISFSTSWKLHPICIPYLLKASSNKEEKEEAKEEVEIALLALRSVNVSYIENELYLNEIKETIEYHQEHHNLTRLAYQSAWNCMIKLFYEERNLEKVVNKLDFVKEAINELEELKKCVDWKKEKEEEKRKKEVKEVFIIWRWLDIIRKIISQCKLWNEEFVGLIGSIVELYRAAKDGHRGIRRRCIYTLTIAARSEPAKVDDLLKGGAIDAVFEELHQPTLEDGNACECLDTVLAISRRLEGKTVDEMEEAKRKEMNRKVFEKMEEEGCEDCITSFYEMLTFLEFKYE